MKYLSLCTAFILLAGGWTSLTGCHSTDTSTKQPKDSTDNGKKYVIESPVTKRIVKNTDLIYKVHHDTVFQVSEGVKETDIYYESQLFYPMHVFILRVDLNNPQITLEAAFSYDGSNFTRKTVPAMAKEADSKGHRVVAAVNADFFSFSTNKPVGNVVKNGHIVKGGSKENFFALLSNGKPYIGTKADFASMKGQLKEALGGRKILVSNDKVQLETNNTRAPRTGVGLTGKGIVYFIVVDGRASGYSLGMTLKQVGIMLKACGATKAINLDGGGSSTFLIQKNGKWKVRNKPSDGPLRPVTDAWLVISKK